MTAYELRISDWSSDVCSSDLREEHRGERGAGRLAAELPQRAQRLLGCEITGLALEVQRGTPPEEGEVQVVHRAEVVVDQLRLQPRRGRHQPRGDAGVALLEHELLGRIEEGRADLGVLRDDPASSDEPTTALQSPIN